MLCERQSLAGIEGAADTLEQLWISYNKVEKLAPLIKMTKIKTLYMAHNNVKYEGIFPDTTY